MGRCAGDPEAMAAVIAGLEARRRRVLLSFWTTIAGSLVGLAVIAAPLVFLGWVGAEHPAGSADAATAARVREWLQAHGEPFPFLLLLWPAGGLFAVALTLQRCALRPRRAYLHQVKQRLFAAVCRERFPGITYQPGGGIPWKLFDGSGLFPYESDVYHSEDRFSGRWGDTDVCFAEAWAQRVRRRWSTRGTDTTHEEYFRGLVFIADFHKHFHSTTRLLPNGEEGSRSRGERPATLEDPVFEGLFDVWTTDQVDVRYVLSTSTMARLVALSRRFPRLRARLADENLLLLLPTRRALFEPSLHRRAASPVQLERFVHDVEACLGVVDDLGLNTRIWSKR